MKHEDWNRLFTALAERFEAIEADVEAQGADIEALKKHIGPTCPSPAPASLREAAEKLLEALRLSRWTFRPEAIAAIDNLRSVLSSPEPEGAEYVVMYQERMWGRYMELAWAHRAVSHLKGAVIYRLVAVDAKDVTPR